MQVVGERVQGMDQQECHSMSPVQDAASDAQLQLSESPLSTSPDRCSSTMSSTPPHLAIKVVPASVIRFAPPYPTREQALKSVRESIPHRMKLQQLQKSEKEHQKDARWHRGAVRKLRKELCYIVSLYAVFQSVIFAAVAQSSALTCADRWGLACVVGAVTVGTVVGALDKLNLMRQEKELTRKMERRQRAVYSKVSELRSRGSACRIESLQPAVEIDGDPGIEGISSVLGMLGFIVGFPAFILAFSWLKLCRPWYCNTT